MQIQNAIITGSFSYNGADLSNVTSSNAYSASLSSRTTDLESTSSVLIGASSSFSSVLSSVSSSQQQLSSSFLTLTASFNAVSASQQQISSSQQQLSSSILTLTASYTALSSSYTSLSASYNTFSGSASTRITENSSSIQQISSSQQQISSSLLNVISIFATTGSNSFRATQSITGSLTVTGQIIAQTLNVQQVTSSIIYSSGSNNFGCDLNSRQTFTGSFYQTGSVSAFYSCVGIGTNFPTKALEIFSNVSQDGIKISGASNPRLTIIDTTNSVQFDALTTDTEAVLRTDTNHPLHLSTNGSLRLTIASTGAATFACSVTADGGASEGSIKIERDTVGTNTVIGSLAFTNNNSATTYGKVFGGRNSAGDGYVALGTGVSNNLYALESGNVGIGTSSTTCRRLTIFGESTCVRGIAFRGCATGDGGNIFLEGYDTDDNEYSNFEFVPNSGNGYFAFNSGAGSNCNNWTQNTRMVIGTSGRVGIGTCTPSAALNVSCVPSSYFGIIETTGTSTGTVKHFRVHKPNCVEYGIGILADNAFHISTASTFPTGNGFTIATNGFVGIGQQAPGGRLEIMNCSATTWSIIARHAVSSGTIYGILSTIQNQAPNNTSSYLFYGDDNVQARMIVYSNGTVSNATGTYNTIASDIRLKQDITNASSQWCDIKNLRLVNFRFKKDVENEGEGALRHLGLIAQEVEETSPNLVEEVTDRCGSTHKTIKTSIIHLKAVKALQEAMCRIEMQQETINMLKTCLGII